MNQPTQDLRARIQALDPMAVLPRNRGLYFGGQWHVAEGGALPLTSPSTGAGLGEMGMASTAQVDRAFAAAQQGFAEWRELHPFQRARYLREAARVLREHAVELAMIDAVDCGNPVREMTRDGEVAAAGLEYFAGLVQETKGETIPMGPGNLNLTLREPLGVCVRIIPYNHPLLFAAMRAAAPLAAGNVMMLKPPEQAPLSSLRLAELWDGVLPPGVFNVVCGGRETGEAMVTHPLTAKVALIGSVATGRAVMKAAAERITPVALELGGKNALIAFPDADPEAVADAAVAGMNFVWCGQSCGSTSRVFLHDSLHDAVLEGIRARCEAIRPGLPTDYDSDMGAIISQAHFDRIMGFVATARDEGAELVAGGTVPDDPALAGGLFMRPTVFAGVTPGMTIAREEIFGPVLSVMRWSEESDLWPVVNGVDYGLTASIWTNDLGTAIRAARTVESGFVWVNNTSQHFIGAPFGGFKQSGMGKEESLDELLDYTRVKNVNIRL
ncbi:MAG: aldehyde dehydrogenase family protein [Pararhodobacter sp.]